MNIIWEFGMPPQKSKAEKRREKKLEKIQREDEKKVRLISAIPSHSKVVRNDWKPELKKNVFIPFKLDEYKNFAFEWCVTVADREGIWSWGEPRDWSDHEFTSFIESHLDSLKNNTWLEVENLEYNGAGKYRKRLNKYQPLDSLCIEAQERWLSNPLFAEFGEDPFRLRKGKFKRIWGLRHFNHFFLIWFERNHKICPPEN